MAVAAKMISNQCVLQWDASLADKMISQAEMLGLLAEKGYLHLLSSRSQNVHIDANVLRHVRDKLLEFEQWHLALEVSTKVGLDTAGKQEFINAHFKFNQLIMLQEFSLNGVKASLKQEIYNPPD